MSGQVGQFPGGSPPPPPPPPPAPPPAPRGKGRTVGWIVAVVVVVVAGGYGVKRFYLDTYPKLMERASAAEQSGDYDKAARLCERARDVSQPGTPEHEKAEELRRHYLTRHHIQQAESAAETLDWTLVIQHANAGLETATPGGEDETHLRELLRQGRLQNKLGFSDLFERARAALKRSEPETAVEILENAEEFAPREDGETYALLARAYRLVGRYMDAQRVLRILLDGDDAVDPLNALGHLERAYVRLYHERNVTAAIESVSDALAAMTDEDQELRLEAYYLRGLAYRMAGSFEDAARDLANVLQEDRRGEVFVNYAETLLALERFDEARRVLEDLLTLEDEQAEPDKLHGRVLLARAHANLDEEAVARRYLSQALAMNYLDLRPITETLDAQTPERHAALGTIVLEPQFAPIASTNLFMSLRKIYELYIVADMIMIDAGEFEQGSPPGPDRRDEQPRSAVELSAFYADRCEVTNREYERFLQAIEDDPEVAADYEHPSAPHGKSHVPEHWFDPAHGQARPEAPVVSVDWYDAYAYATWAEKTLPTESEWERLASAGRETTFPWGDEDPERDAVNIDDAFRGTRDVGTAPGDVTPEGAHDLGGNVSEWCFDYYDGEYYKKRGAHVIDPVRDKPPEGAAGVGSIINDRVVRGGAWNSKLGAATVTRRHRFPPETRATNLGFRCVRAVDEELRAFEPHLPLQLATDSDE